MSKLDVKKEEIGYLKVWLGITVITNISLVSWLVTSAAGAAVILVTGAVVAVAVITSILFSIHRRIEKRIKELEEL